MNENKVIENKFDYSVFDIETREFLRIKESLIKIRTNQTIVENGRDLWEAKEKLIGNKDSFHIWVEKALGIRFERAYEYIRIYKQFGSIAPGAIDDFHKKALVLLSSPSVSDKTRQEALNMAESGEKVTEKFAKELKEKEEENKRLQKLLDEKKQPNLNNLISGLKIMLDNGDIQPAIANNYSQLSKEDQESQLLSEKSRLNYLSQWQRLESEKKEMQNKFDDAVNESSSQIIAAKNAEIEQVKKNLAQSKIDIREQLKDSIRLEIDREYQDDLIEQRKAKEKAEREKKIFQDKNSAMAKSLTEKDRELEKLKDQIQVDSPSNIDNSRAIKMEFMKKEIELNAAEIRKEIDIAGGEMQETKTVIDQMIDILTDLQSSFEKQLIIDI